MRYSVLTAAAAARAIVKKVFALDEVWKATKKKPNPLSPSGFDAYVLQLLTELSDTIGPVEAAAAKEFSGVLQRQWGGLSAKQREAAMREAKTKYLAGVKAVPDMLFGSLQTQGQELAEATRAANAKVHALKIQPSLSLVDVDSVNALASAQALYVTNSHKQIVEDLSEKARAIVSKGLEEGLDDYEIGAQLSAAIPAEALGRTQAYMRMISATFIARARAATSLQSFADSGAGAFEIIGILDGLTCEPCRYMHGRVFGVQSAISAQAAANSNPEAVKDTLPWLYVGKDPDAESGKSIWTKVGGNKIKVAAIGTASGGGNDAVGRYRSALTSKQMSSMGIGSPPFHGHCRCVMVPVYGGDRVRERGPAPAEVVDQPDDITPQAAPTILRPKKLVPPTQLPANINELVRPLPEYRDYETPGPFTPKPSPEVLWKMKMAELPTSWVDGYIQPPSTGVTWEKHSGSSVGADFAFAKVPPATMKKLEKTKPSFTLFDEVNTVSGNSIVSGDHTLKALKGEASPQASAVPVLFKKGGLLWYADDSVGYGAKLQATMAWAKGEKGFMAVVHDLDAKEAKAAKPKKPKAPKVLPAVSTPTPPPLVIPDPPVTLGDASARTQLGSASNILKTKDGEARGSNTGGFYVGDDGVRRYVKFYDDATQVWSEHLANSVYSDLGLGAPKSEVFEHNGKIAYSSKIFEGGKTLAEKGVTEERAKKFAKGFVADVLTGNWDAVGMTNDNAMELTDGSIVRIDNGGTFLFRAKAGRKPEAVLNAITEWDVFWSSKNPAYSSMMSKAGYAEPVDAAKEIIQGIKTIQALEKREGGWKAYVDKIAWGMPDADRAKVVTMLESRSKLLAEKEAWLVAELAKPKAAPPAPGQARYIAKAYSTTTPRKGLTMDDLPTSNLIASEKLRKRRDHLPGGESRDDYLARIRASAKYSRATYDAIRDFSGDSYTSIRKSEAEGSPSPLAKDIHKGFDQVAAEPGTVFRGIELKRDVGRGETEPAFRKRIQATIESYLENESGLFQLGFKTGSDGVTRFADGTSSSTWDIDVAVNFMKGEVDSSTLKIMYKMNARTAIPIEHISAFEHERERLLKHDSVWKITGLSKHPSKQNTLIVEADEVDPAEAQKGGVP